MLEIFERSREILVRAGWMSYFTRLQVLSSEISLEFLHHLQNGQSIVKGVRIIVSKGLIAELSRLSTEGAVWSKNHVMLHDMVEIFKDASEELTRKGKGIQPSSLGEPWCELTSVV